MSYKKSIIYAKITRKPSKSVFIGNELVPAFSNNYDSKACREAICYTRYAVLTLVLFTGFEVSTFENQKGGMKFRHNCADFPA